MHAVLSLTAADLKTLMGALGALVLVIPQGPAGAALMRTADELQCRLMLASSEITP